MPVVTVQGYLRDLLSGLEMPYGQPAAACFVTPPDPYIKARVPTIYVWPTDGEENRSPELGGTVPRNSGPNTPSGTKGILHQFDVYLTWFGYDQGEQGDPLFPGMMDAVMSALRYSQPNPAYITDPNTGLTSTIYNVGEQIRYRSGLESTAEERFLRYDALFNVSIWEILNA